MEPERGQKGLLAVISQGALDRLAGRADALAQRPAPVWAAASPAEAAAASPKSTGAADDEDCGLCEKTEDMVRGLLGAAGVSGMAGARRSGGGRVAAREAGAAGAGPSSAEEAHEGIKDCMFCRISGCLTGIGLSGATFYFVLKQNSRIPPGRPRATALALATGFGALGVYRGFFFKPEHLPEDLRNRLYSGH